MTERRTPRGWGQQSVGEDNSRDVPPVHPSLVEWLEKTYPVQLSPSFGGGSPHHVVNDQAEQRGRQQVIDYLRSISTRHQE